ncbi:2-dehydro-3-deoxygalactonokinase [Elioraea sp. Yellowstone]|jgi:2-dehydro-3-deoxygalactonokinase|uniref:2-dehydro-3-deoxygalactonokinase n=1 Tax=Elioraea sp. Yellowstone TaxID=2592070 RepID=UPI00114DC843|nr:2-dehydro-3-deoxygalactonokinase [Elioraea sp. Yellowstone]TQF83726.1 2-dehydro-3-deoxygalactonokinase [Elioraea sp. Yellowstone]
MIAVDWGLTSFRAWRLAPDGTVQDRVAGPFGIRALADRDFAAVLGRAVGVWRPAPVLMCGMIGSRQGWVEAPYVAAPAGLAAIAAALAPVPGIDRVWIVPGVSQDPPDVMRGEETQIMGVTAALGPGRHVLCLPGTHSKWAVVEDGQVVGFRTAMTGELFGLMRAQSILAPLIPEDAGDDAAAFEAGLACVRAEGGLLHHLFGLRAGVLLGRLAPAALPSLLSGLLIGHEIAELAAEAREVHLVGSPALTGRYARALACFGIAATRHGEETAARGLFAIAREAGIA